MDTFEEVFNRLTDEQKAEAFRKTIESLPEEAFEPVTNEPKFNYCVGAYWKKNVFSDGNSIGTYTLHNDVFYDHDRGGRVLGLREAAEPGQGLADFQGGAT